MLPDPVVHLLQTQFGLAGLHQLRDLLPDRNERRRVHRPGARLWSTPASTLWGFGRHRLLPAHVAIPRRHPKHVPLGRLHVVRDLDPRDLTHHLDIPVARPERVVLWIAGELTARYGHEIALERTEKILDQAWRQRLIDGNYVHELAARSGGKGRSGIVVFRQALESRPPDYQPAGSHLEERFEQIVSPAAARRLRRQVTVDVQPVIRTVDYRVDDRPAVVEINGEAWHTSLTDRRADDER